jgi:hypothetical protein
MSRGSGFRTDAGRGTPVRGIGLAPDDGVAGLFGTGFVAPSDAILAVCPRERRAIRPSKFPIRVPRYVSSNVVKSTMGGLPAARPCMLLGLIVGDG